MLEQELKALLRMKRLLHKEGLTKLQKKRKEKQTFSSHDNAKENQQSSSLSHSLDRLRVLDEAQSLQSFKSNQRPSLSPKLLGKMAANLAFHLVFNI